MTTATDDATGTLSYSVTGLPAGLSISSITGTISGTIGSGALASSPYTTTITATDGTHTDTDTFTWDINAAGPVFIINPGNQTSAASGLVALQIEGANTTNAPWHYTVTGLPPGLYINPVTGFLFGTLASNANVGSPYSVTVKAADINGNNYSQTFTWTVTAAATVTLTNPGDQTTTENTAVSLALTSHDSGTGTMHYVAFGLPLGLSINTGTGAITGTVAIGAAAYAPYTVTVIANDGTYSAQQTFIWTVNSVIALGTGTQTETNHEGDTVSVPVTATDGSHGTLSYSAQGLPTGLMISPTTGTITGTVAKGTAVNGPYNGTITAADNTYSVSGNVTWTILGPITITVPSIPSYIDGTTGVSVPVSV